ncbi:carboxymuconolactone decarboxylase family protein [Pedobacter frigidisoli]|uniref:Carboxymuconolactone decarboxylase family protein n=1 Tax=Pedobacter frigidisoli TaxID=2530455 RepID=A0A4R0NCP8_9SPHI|nr:carboxymuconolactone decarboxylase family protein [Pedobacter frigidisoli]TCC98119.1 carboxymuconolactone decarboxylase family protein [Pedobacter frigidisoli]
MSVFTVPTKEEVSEKNQAIFDQLKGAIGMVPNLYAYFAKNENALSDYMALQNRKSTLKAKEREIINLVVSQVNDCQYCLAAHTGLGKMNGFTDEQILEIRNGKADFDAKFDALAKFVKEVAITRGHPADHFTDALLEAGYTEAGVIDIMIVIGDKTISNYLYGFANFAIDFPKPAAL